MRRMLAVLLISVLLGGCAGTSKIEQARIAEPQRQSDELRQLASSTPGSTPSPTAPPTPIATAGAAPTPTAAAGPSAPATTPQANAATPATSLGTVLKKYIDGADAGRGNCTMARLCLDYELPGHTVTACRVGIGPAPGYIPAPQEQRMIDDVRPWRACWVSALVGGPLPACWR